MVKDSDKLRGGFDIGETGGALSGLLADDEELDRRALWRLGTWAAVSVGAVVVALLANQSSITLRHEQSASADLLKQAQQLQLTAKESQNETRRLSSAIDTLNSDRDRLYSRVAVLEQGLDSVTGAIARQGAGSSAPLPSAGQANASQANTSQSGTSQASATPGGLGQGNAIQGTAVQTIANPGVPTGAPVASTAALPQASNQSPSPPAAAVSTTASIDAASTAVKSTIPPAAAPVTTTAPAVTEKAAATTKSDKQSAAATAAEPGSAKSTTEQQNQNGQPLGSLMASKSMMGPPDPAAGKLIEPATSAKAIVAAPLPEIAAVTPVPKAADEPEAAAVAAPPELVAPHTEFGVDVGTANSIPGLRALWRGLLKSRSNAALTKLRPVIVIKENNNGLGMQLRLVAGPISDAAAAAKICASLTVSDRGCSTAVFEGQRLALGADEIDKTAASKPEATKPEVEDKPAQSSSRSSSHRHYYSSKRPKVVEEPPKPEPSTLSRLFGKRE
ncbi:MAG TPA: hypothetical protein VFL62_07735 [Bradyrhizobium sp.]|uniref:hypothetical protein n=1 Tax=Bradyrhizobium sp. TaxID=376 RepID=UPI002D807F13|nr:hypothetical protein [Bradyrhizobium sp.]HET7886099.1 hypothetical protein [Bradyrhizobium sp.]